MRTYRGEEEQKIREERAEHSGGERVKFSEKNGCFVTRIVEIEIANRE